MPVSPGTRSHFGRAMRDRRRNLQPRMTLRVLASNLKAKGDDVTEATLSGYERGEYAPGRDRAMLIDAELGAGGELVAILGFSTEEYDPVQLADVLTRVQTLEDKFDLILERLEQAGLGAGQPSLPADRGELPRLPA